MQSMKNAAKQSVAAPAGCSWQGTVRSLVALGRAVNISIYEQRFMSSDQTFQMHFIVSKTSTFRTCWTV